MPNYFFMDKSLLAGRKIPTPDTIVQRGAWEGHNSGKQLKVNAFENSQSDDPDVNHTTASDTCLRFKKLYNDGTLAEGDRFVLGLVTSLTELDMLVAEQENTVPGLQLKITVLDHMFAQVEDEGLLLDFSNAEVDGRWATQPVHAYNYDESTDLLKAGRGEYFYLVAEIAVLPENWFDECGSCCCPLPELSARLHYQPLCVNTGLDTCAPQDVLDAYNAAIEAFEDANTIYIWDNIEVMKDPVLGM